MPRLIASATSVRSRDANRRFQHFCGPMYSPLGAEQKPVLDQRRIGTALPDFPITTSAVFVSAGASKSSGGGVAEASAA